MVWTEHTEYSKAPKNKTNREKTMKIAIFPYIIFVAFPDTLSEISTSKEFMEIRKSMTASTYNHVGNG